MPKKTNKKETAVVVAPETTPVDPTITSPNPHSIDQLLSQAIAQGVSADVVERFMAMRREMRAEWAKEQYVKAMAQFQADCPVIKKTKSVLNKQKELMYKYAPLDSIIFQTKALIQKHGFSYSTEIDTTRNQAVKATCVITHINGHSERYEMEVPFGNKTEIMSHSQVTAAASTFAKRYAFQNGFGIMTSDEDNDARFTDEPVNDGKPISDEERKVIADFEKAKKLLSSTTNVGTLRAFQEQLKGKTRYDKKQLKELNDLIDAKTKELNQPA